MPKSPESAAMMIALFLLTSCKYVSCVGETQAAYDESIKRKERGGHRVANAQNNFLLHAQYRAARFRFKVGDRFNDFCLTRPQGILVQFIGPFVRALPPDESTSSIGRSPLADASAHHLLGNHAARQSTRGAR